MFSLLLCLSFFAKAFYYVGRALAAAAAAAASIWAMRDARKIRKVFRVCATLRSGIFTRKGWYKRSFYRRYMYNARSRVFGGQTEF